MASRDVGHAAGVLPPANWRWLKDIKVGRAIDPHRCDVVSMGESPEEQKELGQMIKK